MTDTDHDPAIRDDTTGSGKNKPQSSADGGDHAEQRDNGKAADQAGDQVKGNAKEKANIGNPTETPGSHCTGSVEQPG